MKKLISAILTLAMVMTMSLTVFAVDQGESTTVEVKGTYTGKETEVVYSVDISWTAMDFTYNDAYEGEWDAATHTYKNATPANWEGTGTITITNHSNAAIKATPAYAAAAGYADASMGFDTAALNVASAATNNAAETGTITVTPAGKLPAGTTSAVIGTITVTIE